MARFAKFLLLICAFSTLPAARAAAAPTPAFDALDLVPLGPKNAVYDVYTIGDASQSYPARRWITPFKMNRYETTYELWYDVRIVAEALGYTFKNKGEGGSRGKTGAAPTAATSAQPVTLICWYDAIVWCNALSQIHGLTPCYTYRGKPLTDATDSARCDLAECDWDADGFRLPTEAEWEYSARWLPAGYLGGDLISGQVAADGRERFEEDVAWTPLNAMETHTVGTAGTPFDGAALPAPGSGNANAAGIFDMGGNVLEFCWDWMAPRYDDVPPGSRATGPEYGSERVCRGGSWSTLTPFSSAGDRYQYNADESHEFLGFRIVQGGR